jgi:hypothetical protein
MAAPAEVDSAEEDYKPVAAAEVAECKPADPSAEDSVVEDCKPVAAVAEAEHIQAAADFGRAGRSVRQYHLSKAGVAALDIQAAAGYPAVKLADSQPVTAADCSSSLVFFGRR